MSIIYNLICKVFEWALFLSLVGGLGEATMHMYQEAGRARAQGLISLTALNRSLGMGDSGTSIQTGKR